MAILFWPSSDIEKPQAAAATIMESSNSMAQTPEGAILVTMYKNEGCMCCTRWAEHMNKEGFYVIEKITRQLGEIKSEQGISNELASCHTAMIDGYIVEGHVPPQDVQRLLEGTSGMLLDSQFLACLRGHLGWKALIQIPMMYS